MIGGEAFRIYIASIRTQIELILRINVTIKNYVIEK